MEKIHLVSRVIDLEQSELLYDFREFDPADWTITRHSPPWRVEKDAITGGKPDENAHGQIFCRKTVTGDILMEFDAELVGDSYHDIICWWGTSLDQDPWGEGYLGCLGGWWNNLAGIEKSPAFEPSCICPASPIAKGTRYHILAGGIGNVQFVVTDGVMSCYLTDPDPATRRGGYFGFGVYQSHVRYSALKVYRPHWEMEKHDYLPDSECR